MFVYTHLVWCVIVSMCSSVFPLRLESVSGEQKLVGTMTIWNWCSKHILNRTECVFLTSKYFVSLTVYCKSRQTTNFTFTISIGVFKAMKCCLSHFPRRNKCFRHFNTGEKELLSERSLLSC